MRRCSRCWCSRRLQNRCHYRILHLCYRRCRKDLRQSLARLVARIHLASRLRRMASSCLRQARQNLRHRLFRSPLRSQCFRRKGNLQSRCCWSRQSRRPCCPCRTLRRWSCCSCCSGRSHRTTWSRCFRGSRGEVRSRSRACFESGPRSAVMVGGGRCAKASVLYARRKIKMCSRLWTRARGWKCAACRCACLLLACRGVRSLAEPKTTLKGSTGYPDACAAGVEGCCLPPSQASRNQTAIKARNRA